MSEDDGFDDFLVAEELLTEAISNDAVESDEERQIRFRKDIDGACNGTELYNYVVEKLPISGQKFGSSLSMNRALSYLKSVKLCEELTPTWANCKKANRDVVAAVFGGVMGDTVIFASLKASVLEGIVVKKVAATKVAAKARNHQVLILDEQEAVTVNSGRTMDRVALLACALADPEMTPMFTAISAPIEAGVRPAFLDLGAIHVTLARWTAIAEAVMERREGYSNPFKELVITGHGTVLADIDPSKGVFYSTASTSMGKQFKDLMTSSRKTFTHINFVNLSSYRTLKLFTSGSQNMLLDGRVYKSGYNSNSTDLFDSAYLRTGTREVLPSL